jgi:cytochrome P450
MMEPANVIERFDEPDFYGGDPHATYRRLRSEDPVFWYEEGGFWVLTKYEHIKFVSSQPKQFSSQGVAILSDLLAKRAGEEVDRSGDRGVMFLDPPKHGVVRKPVSQRFTPKAVLDMEVHVRSVILGILDELPDGPFDWIERLAEPVPVHVFSALLGLPREDWDRVSSWATTIVKPASGQATEEDWAIISNEIFPYLWGQITARMETPKDDLLTLLTTARIDDKPFDEIQVITWATTLLAAGSETTQSLIGGLGQILMDRPDVLALIRSDPSLAAGAIEEALRWWTPVTSMAREAVQDVQLGDTMIRKGDGVLLLYPSGNRDEERWGEDADVFNPTRKDASGHLGFGFGEHFCVGAHLARREGRVLLEELARRYTAVVPTGSAVLRSSTIVHTYDHLPVQLVR